MTRVHERHLSAAPSAADRHRRVNQKKKKTSYKVILEEVADKQKKLKTVLYPEQKAPRGYTFIPAGDPQLTNRCKKLAREDGFTVFIVSTSRHPRQGLSREIHRVGFHFPSVTVEKACDSLGVTLSNSGRVLQSNFAYLEDGQDGQEYDGKRSTKQRNKKAGNRNQQPALDISLPQAVIDTSARETIKDLFPNIPNEDLHAIVGRSFQKGKGHVGTVANLSLVRRAQLAVIAHIRHTYTDYDALLKQVQYNEARRRVEKPCLDRLIQWRGDDHDTGDMEDVLREVIVIPDDDDDSNDEGNESKESPRIQPGEIERDSSVEYISEADMHIRSVDYSNINRTIERGDSNSPESEQEIQYLGRNKIHHVRRDQYDQHTLDRMGMHRQRVYKEALDRRKKYPEIPNVYNRDSSIPVVASSGHDKVYPPSLQAQDRDYQPHLIERMDQALGRAPIQTRLLPVPRVNGYIADAYSSARDPKYVLEEKVACPPQQDWHNYEECLEQPKRVYYTEEDRPHAHRKQLVELRQPPNRGPDLGERLVNQDNTRQENGNSLYADDFKAQSRRLSEIVLPSIERDIPNEHSDLISLNGRSWQVNPFGPYRPLSSGMQQLPAPSDTTLDDYEDPPSGKRRRIDNQQPVNSHGHSRTMLVPLEQIDDHQPWYQRPHEAIYRDDGEHSVSDKRIVPLPPKGERARSPIGHQELQVISPHKQLMRRPDQVVDRVERYPQSRAHYQTPLSRAENVEDSHFPSRTKVMPPVYLKDSPSVFQSSQVAPRYIESSDLGVSSRHRVGVIANSDRTYANSNGMTRHLQPSEVAERSTPPRFSDMSIAYRHRDDGGRPDPATYLPVTGLADLQRQTGPSTARDVLYEGMKPPANAYPGDDNERHMYQTPRVQHQPLLPTKHSASLPHLLDQHSSKPDRANAWESGALPPAPRAAMEPWDPNSQSRTRPLGRGPERRLPFSPASAVRYENIRPFRHDYDDFPAGQRKRPNDIIVLD